MRSKKPLSETHPEVAKFWHPTKNGDLTPDDVTYGSRQKIWWRCPKGDDHEYLMTPNAKTSQNQGCSVCSGKLVVRSNSLRTIYPEISKQWHPTKNEGLTPDNFTPGSNKKVWWQCPERADHVYQQVISNKTLQNQGCPICAGHLINRDNCLANLFPDVAKEWNYEKNGDLTPKDVTGGSSKKVWWKCPKGEDHVWKASISERTGRGSSCPACYGRMVVLSNSLITTNPSIARYWHPVKNGQLTPKDVTQGSNISVWWTCPKDKRHDYKAAIYSITKGGGCPYCRGLKVNESNSLAALRPEIAKLWHNKKNGTKTPNDFTVGSQYKAWWKCPVAEDHVYQMTIGNKTLQNQGCPMCSNRKLVNSNCLLTTHPKIAKQWHPTKNGDLTPEDLTAQSVTKVWWQCPVGEDHVWKTPVYWRGNLGQGCPICSGKKVVQSTSLANLHPEIAKQWHSEKNGTLTQSDVTVNSSKNVWWQCEVDEEHVWKSQVATRTNGRGCPFCANRYVSSKNNLQAMFPIVSKMWDTEANGKEPNKVLAGSHHKAHWKCLSFPNHKWIAVIKDVVSGSRCPYCANYKVSEENNMEVTHPDIAKQWHPTLNGNLKPKDVIAGSRRKIWWQCDNFEDHVYQTALNNKTSGKSNCPICAGKLITEFNSLASNFPELIKEWDFDLNRSITPDKIHFGAHKKVWWKCRNNPDHVWKTNPKSRTSNKSGCPYCSLVPQSKQELTISFELKSIFPSINPRGFKVQLDRLTSIDIFIPSLNLGIEFDGHHWHKDKVDFDKMKSKKIREAGFKLIRIREEPLEKLSPEDIISHLPFNAKKITDQILRHILYGLELPLETINRIKAYRSEEELQNEAGLNRYIERVLKKKAEK